MGLNEILEENSIKSISQKTRISEENIEDLFAENFKKINKTKALGFISIIEREYKANLSALKTKAIEYYGEEVTGQDFVIAMPSKEGPKKKSKSFFVIVLLLLVVASWYFLSQYGQKHEISFLSLTHTRQMNDANISATLKEEVKQPIENLSIAKAIASTKEDENNESNSSNDSNMTTEEKGHIALVTENSVEHNETLDLNKTTQTSQVEVAEVQEPVVETKALMRHISLVPVKKVWFGTVNLETKELQNLTVDQPYVFDIENASWLVATSAASFAMVDGDKTEKFTGKRCYFKIDKNGVQVLDKDQFVNAGGSKKW